MTTETPIYELQRHAIPTGAPVQRVEYRTALPVGHGDEFEAERINESIVIKCNKNEDVRAIESGWIINYKSADKGQPWTAFSVLAADSGRIWIYNYIQPFWLDDNFVSAGDKVAYAEEYPWIAIKCYEYGVAIDPAAVLRSFGYRHVTLLSLTQDIDTNEQ